MMDVLIERQMKKLQSKARFIREFWQAFEAEKEELGMLKEEILAERLALTTSKTRGKQTRNSFFASKNLIQELNNF